MHVPHIPTASGGTPIAPELSQPYNSRVPNFIHIPSISQPLDRDRHSHNGTTISLAHHFALGFPSNRAYSE